MKKYFVLHEKDESASEFPDKYNWENPKSSSALKKYIRENNDFPEFLPILEQEIYDDPEFNKVNDFIFGPVEKYCVSKKIKEVLSKFNLPKHKFYPVSVYKQERVFFNLIKTTKRIEKEYFAFHYDCHYISNTDHFIDYDKTVISKDNFGIEQSKEVFFNDKFDYSLDLFEIKFSWMTYVSEKLKNELIEIGATGIEFSEISERQYFVERPNPKLNWK